MRKPGSQEKQKLPQSSQRNAGMEKELGVRFDTY